MDQEYEPRPTRRSCIVVCYLTTANGAGVAKTQLPNCLLLNKYNKIMCWANGAHKVLLCLFLRPLRNEVHNWSAQWRRQFLWETVSCFTWHSLVSQWHRKTVLLLFCFIPTETHAAVFLMRAFIAAMMTTDETRPFCCSFALLTTSFERSSPLLSTRH